MLVLTNVLWPSGPVIYGALHCGAPWQRKHPAGCRGQRHGHLGCCPLWCHAEAGHCSLRFRQWKCIPAGLVPGGDDHVPSLLLAVGGALSCGRIPLNRSASLPQSLPVLPQGQEQESVCVFACVCDEVVWAVHADVTEGKEVMRWILVLVISVWTSEHFLMHFGKFSHLFLAVFVHDRIVCTNWSMGHWSTSLLCMMFSLWRTKSWMDRLHVALS